MKTYLKYVKSTRALIIVSLIALTIFSSCEKKLEYTTYGVLDGTSFFKTQADASFLRCQDIMLSYNLPDKVLGDRKIFKRVNISFDVNNAFIITKYPYLDPQINQGSFYPLNRGFIIGVNAGF